MTGKPKAPKPPTLAELASRMQSLEFIQRSEVERTSLYLKTQRAIQADVVDLENGLRQLAQAERGRKDAEAHAERRRSAGRERWALAGRTVLRITAWAGLLCVLHSFAPTGHWLDAAVGLLVVTGIGLVGWTTWEAVEL